MRILVPVTCAQLYILSYVYIHYDYNHITNNTYICEREPQSHGFNFIEYFQTISESSPGCTAQSDLLIKPRSPNPSWTSLYSEAFRSRENIFRLRLYCWVKTSYMIMWTHNLIKATHCMSIVPHLQFIGDADSLCVRTKFNRKIIIIFSW